MKKILLLLSISLISAYSALWYFSNRWLEQQFSFTEKHIAIGETTTDAKYDLSLIKRTGFFRGRAGVLMKINSIQATVHSPLSPTISQEITPTGGKELIYEISAPLWGRSFQCRIVGPTAFTMNSSQGSSQPLRMIIDALGTQSTLFFRDSKLLLARGNLWEGTQAPSIPELLKTFSKIEYTPGEISVKVQNATAPLITAKGAHNVISWSADPDMMVTLEGQLDIHGKYDQGFLELITNPQFAKTPPRTEELAVVEIAKELFAHFAPQLVAKGKFKVQFPRHFLNANQATEKAIEEQYPFAISLTDFVYDLPFTLSGPGTVTANIEFLTGEGKPLVIDFHQKVAGQDLNSKVNALIPTLKTQLLKINPSMGGLDLERNSLESLQSIDELMGSQGAYVMIKNAIDTFSTIYKDGSSIDINVKVNTSNGTFAPLALASLNGEGSIALTIGNDLLGLQLHGKAQSIMQFSLDGKITNLHRFIPVIMAPVKVFIARSMVAVFFFGDASDQASEKGRHLVKQLFSKEFDGELTASIHTLLKVFDATPDTTEQIDFSYQISPAGQVVNGQPLEVIEEKVKKASTQEYERISRILEMK